MARRKITPSYRFHKKTGRAIVTMYDAAGRRRATLLPGKFESAESRKEYRRILLELDANEGHLRKEEEKPPELVVSQLIERYMKEHVTTYYVDPDTKQPTGEQENFRCAFRPLKQLFDAKPVSEFEPLDLELLQRAMVKEGLARTTINSRIARVKMMFRWAVPRKLVPASVFHGLLAVPGLKPGRSGARDTQRVEPVAVAVVQETMPKLPPVVRDIVELLLLTGMRVGEAVIMTARDLDTTGPVWLYRPRRHKCKWRGHERTIALGTRAQEIVKKYLTTKTDAFLFSPKVQLAIINAQKRAARKTRVQPSQLCRKKTRPRKTPGEQFTSSDINRAVRRACNALGIERWHVHQLRHTCSREISRHHGLEASRAVLGHRTVSMSAHYSGQDQETAKAVMLKIG